MVEIEQYVTKQSYLIASQIVYFRNYRNLTQKQLADILKITQPAIARLEKTPDLKWSYKTLIKIAEALDMKVSIDFDVKQK